MGFEDPYEEIVGAARKQLNLGDEWRLKRVESSLSVLLDDKIYKLSVNEELTDAERWQELISHVPPDVNLPDGLFLVSMMRETANGHEYEATFLVTKDLKKAQFQDEASIV